ncbi:hypothetical protein Pelo_16484 [Pelomyxa schiedti]|nr:hypothetical protein Pelo_16484 [Pelomyxa schiedti]
MYKAKRQWAKDNTGASEFEIDSFASMVEHNVVSDAARKLDHVSFALGSFLISRERPELPKECTVREYIDSGFKGASTLAKLCDEKESTPLIVRFVVLFIVNLVISLGTIAYWAPGIGVLVTFGIGIYLHWFRTRVLFVWRNPCLSASAMVFGIYGGLFAVIGFALACSFAQHDSMSPLFWYRYWYAWGPLQFVYMVLSSIFLGNTCRLVCGITPFSTVPVPQITGITSLVCVGWVFMGIYVPIFIALIVVGLIFIDWHCVQAVGIPFFWCMFVLPAFIVFLVLTGMGHPKRVSIPGLVASIVLAVASAIATVGFALSGSLFVQRY